jgi:hypothetical protein
LIGLRQERACCVDGFASVAFELSVMQVEHDAREIVEPERGRDARVSQRFGPRRARLRSCHVRSHEQRVGPEELPRAPAEARDVEVEELVARPETRASAPLTVVAQVLEVPQHEAVVTEEPIELPEQRLRLVHPVELDFGLYRDHTFERSSRASEHVELGSLGVELDEVDTVDAALRAPVVQGDEVDLPAVRQALNLESGMAVDDLVDGLVERRAGGFARDVERGRARLGSERARHDLHPRAIVVALAQQLALVLVGLEPDRVATIAELLPGVGESPPASDVGDDDRLVEEAGQDRCDLRRRSCGVVGAHRSGLIAVIAQRTLVPSQQRRRG